MNSFVCDSRVAAFVYLFVCELKEKQVKSPKAFFQENQGWHDSTIQPFGIGRKPGLIPFFSSHIVSDVGKFNVKYTHDAQHI